MGVIKTVSGIALSLLLHVISIAELFAGEDSVKIKSDLQSLEEWRTTTFHLPTFRDYLHPAFSSLQNATLDEGSVTRGSVIPNLTERVGGPAPGEFFPKDTITAAWTRQYESGLHLAYTGGIALAFDGREGTIYIGGSVSTNVKTDFLLVKLNANGDTLWSVESNNPTYYASWISDVEIDSSGNVYVVGSTSYPISRRESYNGVFINKYDSQGQAIWVRKFALDDYRPKLEIDRSQLVIAFAESTILAFEPTGILRWTAHVAEDRIFYPAISHVLLGDAGEFVVMGSGYMKNDYSHGGIFVIKYAGDGTTKWSWTYRDSTSTITYPRALATDHRGNLIIGVESYTYGQKYEIQAIKLSHDGISEWRTVYDGSMSDHDFLQDLQVDRSGSACLLLRSDQADTTTFVTMKIDSTGHLLWAARAFSAPNWKSNPICLRIDSKENIYVLGRTKGADSSMDFLVITYTSSGTLRWTKFFNAREKSEDYASGMAVLPGDTLVVMGSCSNILTTIMLSPDSVQLWMSRYVRFWNTLDIPVRGLLDSDGNICILSSSSSENGKDLLLLKYDSDGQLLWTDRYDDRFHKHDHALSMAIDRNDNIFVAGFSDTYEGISPGPDYYYSEYVVIKYNKRGIRQWVRTRSTGLGLGWGGKAVLATDSSGSVYIACQTIPYSDSGNRITVVKYSSSGQEAWSYVFRDQDTSGYLTQPTGIAVGASQHVYVSGIATKNRQEFQSALLTLSSDGVLMWVRQFASGPGNDCPVAMEIDKEENVFIVGTARKPGPDESIRLVLLKYNSSGDLLWKKEQANPYWDYVPTSLALDSEGCAYVAGYTWEICPVRSDYGGIVMALLKYDSSGSRIWKSTYRPPGDCPGNQYSIISVVAVDRSSNIYVSAVMGNTHIRLTTLKLSPDGKEDWIAFTDTLSRSRRMLTSLMVNPEADVYIASSVLTTHANFYYGYGTTVGSIIQLEKYSHRNPLLVENEQRRQNASLSQNFPNPCNPVTHFQMSIAERELTTLKMYNVLGEEVATLVNEIKEPGIHTVRWDGTNYSSGVYFYRMQAGRFTQVRRLLLVR